MSKRGSLSVAVQDALGKSVVQANGEAGVTARPDREGKAPLPFWVPVSARHQLRILAATLDTTMQACLAEALNDYFRKHGKPPIA